MAFTLKMNNILTISNIPATKIVERMLPFDSGPRSLRFVDSPDKRWMAIDLLDHR